jgi:mannitol-1-phosphate 5-dehydrogenase
MSASRRRSVLVGPGKIGCGHLAPMFLDAGWRTLLAARTEAQAERICTTPFQVRSANRGEARTVSCPAIPSWGDRFDAAVAAADLVVVAVGFRNIPSLGPPLAHALAARGSTSPIDVWVVENSDAAPVLEDAVGRAAAAARLPLPPVGFAGAIAYTVISRGSWKGKAKPIFVGDGVDTILVDETRLVGTLDRFRGLKGTPDYLARLREKAFVFGSGHALCAYLGARLGYSHVHEAAQDPLVSAFVQDSLLEARSAVARMFPSLRSGMWSGGKGMAGLLDRYSNPMLEDPIRRVARDPIRKLAPDGPLVGTAKLVEAATGRVLTAFALGIASALLYRDASDSQARELGALIARGGVQAALQEICGLDPGDPLARAVVAAHRLLQTQPRLGRLERGVAAP